MSEWITPKDPASVVDAIGDSTLKNPKYINAHFRYWCHKTLPLTYDDSLSYYEVWCKYTYWLNKIIEDVNQLISDVGQLHTDLTELQAYCNEYFTLITNSINSLHELVEEYYTELTNKITALDAKVEQYYSNVVNMIETLETKVDSYYNELNTKITNLESKVESYYNELNNKITTLESKVETYYSNLSNTITNNYNTLNNRISNVIEQLSDVGANAKVYEFTIPNVAVTTIGAVIDGQLYRYYFDADYSSYIPDNAFVIGVDGVASSSAYNLQVTGKIELRNNQYRTYCLAPASDTSYTISLTMFITYLLFE